MAARASSLVSVLEPHLRSGATLIVISTQEEERALSMVREASRLAQRQCINWEVASGFSYVGGGRGLMGEDPISALETIRALAGDPVVVTIDFHEFWEIPEVKRRLRNLATINVAEPKTIVVITPESQTPAELADHAVLLRLGLPSHEDLLRVFTEVRSADPRAGGLDDECIDRCARAAMGLTANQARRSFVRAVAMASGTCDPDLIRRDVSTALRRTGFLDVTDSVTEDSGIGGLHALKSWIDVRRRAFEPEARDFGLEPPRGVAFIGHPGTGKSLAARAVGGMWSAPVIDLDVLGLLAGGERGALDRLRNGLEMVGRRAPCVLSIDRLDLALEAGGHAAQRVVSGVLSWAQDAPVGVFVVATANEVTGVVREFVRRSRFDEVFYFDLPTREDREEIISIHLRKRGRNPEAFDVARVAAASGRVSGGELERAIVSAMYVAFNADRDVTTDDLVTAVGAVVPPAGVQSVGTEAMLQLLLDGTAQSATFARREDAVANATTRAGEARRD